MFIFRSAGCVLLRMVFSTGSCGCGPNGPVCQQYTTWTPEDGHI